VIKESTCAQASLTGTSDPKLCQTLRLTEQKIVSVHKALSKHLFSYLIQN